MTSHLPSGARRLAETYPDVWIADVVDGRDGVEKDTSGI